MSRRNSKKVDYSTLHKLGFATSDEEQSQTSDMADGKDEASHSIQGDKLSEISSMEQQIQHMELEIKRLQLVKKLEEQNRSMRRLQNESHRARSPTPTLQARASATNLGIPTGTSRDKALLGLTGENETQYLDISQFTDNSVIGAAPLIAGTDEPSLEKISPTIWIGANSKIMARLLNEGCLNNDQIYAYLAHSLKISQLAQSYTWQSVLKYDRAFRIYQAASNSSWGEDLQHLGTANLEKKTAGPNKHTGQNRTEPGHKAEETRSCTLYNLGRCFFNPCKFIHKCERCSGQHGAWENACSTQPGIHPEDSPRFPQFTGSKNI